MLSGINKNKTADLLLQCLRAIGSPGPGPIDENVRMWSRNGIFVSILEPGVGALEELIDLIEKTGRLDGRSASSVFSREYIETMVQELLNRLIILAQSDSLEPTELTPARIEASLKQWLDSFEIPSEVATYYSLIGNLVLDTPIQIGRITFSPLNDETRQKIMSEFDRINALVKDKEETKSAARQHIDGYLQPNQRLSVAFGAISEAEPEHAQEMFQDRVREVLHALRFFGFFLHPASHRALIDLSGHTYSGKNVFLRLVSDQQFNLAVQSTGFLFPYELTVDRLGHLKTIGLEIVQAIFSKQEDERTALESSCINAIIWFSRALQDDVPDSRFLKLCVAMESLLLKRDDQPYRQVMAERVAFVLGGNLEGRQKIASDLKKIYDIRSAVSHEGRSRKLREWLGAAEFYAAHVVLRFIHLVQEQSWTTENDFIEWIDSLKFA